MSDRFHNALPADSDLFDRLVDGGLSTSEERALLSTLDARPDGWRRCALAFLEARAWKNEFASLTRPIRHNGTPVLAASACPTGSAGVKRACATGSASEVRSSDVPYSQPPPSAKPLHPLALAGCVALAFFLGFAVRNWTIANPRLGHQIADNNGRRTMPAERGDWQGKQTSAHTAAAATPSSVTMTLVEGADSEQTIEVPLRETDRLDPSWLASPPAAVPDSEVEELRRMGFRVDQQRYYVPVVLDDGRRAIVPVDRANVSYAGMTF